MLALTTTLEKISVLVVDDSEDTTEMLTHLLKMSGAVVTGTTFAPEKLPAGETVVITEGALKAETLISFRPKARVIATAGVSSSHNQIIEAARPYNVLIAFDADHRTNPAVCRQLGRLIVQRTKIPKNADYLPQPRLLFGMDQKGLMMQSEQTSD